MISSIEQFSGFSGILTILYHEDGSKKIIHTRKDGSTQMYKAQFSKLLMFLGDVIVFDHNGPNRIWFEIDKPNP